MFATPGPTVRPALCDHAGQAGTAAGRAPRFSRASPRPLVPARLSSTWLRTGHREGRMGFLSRWIGLGSLGAWVACAIVACGGETSGNPFDSDGGQGRGGTSGAAGRGVGGAGN